MKSPRSEAPHGHKPRAAGSEAWWMLAVLCFFYVLSFMDRQLLSMLVEPIQADLGINDFEMGLILGPAFGLGLGLFALPVGWLVDRSPRRKIIFLGVSFWSLATAACGMAQSTVALFAARFGVGIGEAVLGPAATSLIADKFPRERLTTAVAIYQSANKLGTAAAFGIGGLLIGLLGGVSLVVPHLGVLHAWQIIFMLVGLPGALFGFLAYTFSEPARRGRRSAEPPKLQLLLDFLREHRRLMLLMYGGFSIVAIIGYGFMAWAPTFIDRRYGWEPVQYGPALSVISLVAAAALVFKGGLVDWLYARGYKDAHLRFYSWLLLGTMPVALVAFFSPSAWIYLVLHGILAAVSIPSIIYLTASQALLAPNELRGQLTALSSVVYAVLGLGIGPTLVGFITNYVFADPHKLGWSLTLVLGVGMPASACLLRMAMKELRAAVAASEALEQEQK